MATKQDLKDARELLDLDVSEVSLVDRPANLRPFLVVKRQTEDHAGVFEADYSAELGGEADAPIAKVDDDFVGDVSEVVEWMAKAATGAGAPTESITNVASFLGRVAANRPRTQNQQSIQGGEIVDVKKSETVDMIKARHAYEVATFKAGKSDETEEALEQRQKAELEKADDKGDDKSTEPDKTDKADDKSAKPEKTEKTDDKPAEPAKVEKADGEPPPEPDPDDEPAVVIKRDGSVHVAGQVVQKAKTFGKGRTTLLSNAVGALAKLLGDVDETALKSALSDLSDPTKKVETKSAETKKADDSDSPNPILEALNSALEPIKKRLDDIEKTRNPSQSVEPDGGTDKNEPVEKSVWAGIL